MTSVRFHMSALVLIGCLAGAPLHAQGPLGTEFTYQGQLKDGGNPANGEYDLRLALYDALTQGNLVAGPVCIDNVDVQDGLLTAAVDLGVGAFNGDDRFIEVGVRPGGLPGNCGNGNYTVLTPRQPITAAPYALKVPGIDGHSLNAADGGPTDAVFVDSTGNVGVGTLAPVEPLHVAFPVPVLNLQDSDSGPGSQVGLVSFRDSSGVENGWMGYGTSANAHAHFMNNRQNGNTSLGAGGLERLTVRPTGNVGIGTTNPILGRLQVFSSEGITGHFHVTTANRNFKPAIHAQTDGPADKSTVFPTIFATTNSANAIIGSTSRDGLNAIAGHASAVGVGVRGSAPDSGFGVFADGRLGASGTKSFQIDHPLDPEHKFLLHYCTEGPEPLNIYSGTATTDATGVAVVVLPDYFESINRDPRVQLSVEDASDEFVMVKVAGPVHEGRMTIRTSKPGVKVYWEVKAVRNDLWVQNYGAPVEEDKPEAEKGLYQHPELYGLGAEYEMSNGLLRTDRMKPMR